MMELSVHFVLLIIVLGCEVCNAFFQPSLRATHERRSKAIRESSSSDSRWKAPSQSFGGRSPGRRGGGRRGGRGRRERGRGGFHNSRKQQRQQQQDTEIIRRDLFDLFDPSEEPKDLQMRTRRLSEIQDEQMLTSILDSWVYSSESDAGERCYEVLDHLRRLRDEECLSPSSSIYACVLRAYAARRDATRAESVLRELVDDQDVVVPDSDLLRLFSKVMSTWSRSDLVDAPEQCERLLAELKELASERRSEGLSPDTVSYSIVIDAHAKRGRPTEAERVLREMLNNSDEGAKPNVISFTSVMNAWSRSDVSDAPAQCERLLKEMKQLASERESKELAPDTACYSIVIDTYARCGRPAEAKEVLAEMLRDPDGAKPNAASFNIVMNALSRSDSVDAPEQCERLLAEMKELASETGRKELAPNTITYNCVIGAYARSQRPLEAEKVLEGMLTDPDSAKPNVVTLNSVLNAWSRSDVIDAPQQCKRLVAHMRAIASEAQMEELAPDMITYSIVIDAYARRGRPTEAEKVFRQMLRHPQRTKPNVIALNSVMSAWSRSQVVAAPEKCIKLLVAMKQLSSNPGFEELAPDTITYNIVIDAYARRGRPDGAEAVLRAMLNSSNGVKPDVVSFTSAMNAWSNSDVIDSPEQCERLLAVMKRHGGGGKKLVPNEVTFKTIRDAYVRRGRMAEANKVGKASDT